MVHDKGDEMDGSQFKVIEETLFANFDRSEVDEILVNGDRGLWVVIGDRLELGFSPFSSLAQLAAWAQEMARRNGVRLDPICGSGGGSLQQNNFRWHCVLPPLTPDGALLAIRKHRFTQIGLDDFVASPETAAALRVIASTRCHLLIVGPTGSGKTSMMSAILSEYAEKERVVLVEALAELPLPSPCSVRLLERRPNLDNIGAISMTRLVQEALRLRPDRLVIGEVRGHEVAALCEALISGHGGVMATLHANDPDDALARLEVLASGSGWSKAARSWRGIDLSILMMSRGIPPKLTGIYQRHFVPTT